MPNVTRFTLWVATLLAFLSFSIVSHAATYYGETWTTAPDVDCITSSSSQLYYCTGKNGISSYPLGGGSSTSITTALSSPDSVAYLPIAGVLLLAESKGIQRYTTSTSTLTKIAGGSTAGNVDGAGTAARMDQPTGIIVSADESMAYFVDNEKCVVRQMSTPSYTVSTLAGAPSSCTFLDGTGAAAKFDAPNGLAFDANEAALIVADGGNNRLRSVTLPGYVVTTLACTGTAGSADGPALSATCNSPSAVVRIASSGIVYFVDQGTSILRRLSSGSITTVLGTAGSTGTTNGFGAACLLKNPVSLAVDLNGYLYIGQKGAGARVVRVTVTDTTTTTAAPTASTAGPIITVASTTTTTTAVPVTTADTTTTTSTAASTTGSPATETTAAPTTIETTAAPTTQTTIEPSTTVASTLAPLEPTVVPTTAVTATPATETPENPKDTTHEPTATTESTLTPVTTTVVSTDSPSTDVPQTVDATTTTVPTEGTTVQITTGSTTTTIAPLTTAAPPTSSAESTTTTSAGPTNAPTIAESPTNTPSTSAPSPTSTATAVAELPSVPPTTGSQPTTLEPLPPAVTDQAGTDTTPAVTGSLTLKINVETARARAPELRAAIAESAQVTKEAVTILAILPGSAVVQFEIKTTRDPATVSDGMSTLIQSGGALSSFAPVVETLTLQRKPGDALFAVGVAFYSCIGLAIIALGASIGWSVYRRRHPDLVMKVKPTAEVRSGAIYIDVSPDGSGKMQADSEDSETGEKVELLRVGPGINPDSTRGIRVINSKDTSFAVSNFEEKHCDLVIDMDARVSPQGTLSDDEDGGKLSPPARDAGAPQIVTGPGFRRNRSRRRFQGFSASMLPPLAPRAIPAGGQLNGFEMLQRLQPSREVINGDIAAGYAMN